MRHPILDSPPFAPLKAAEASAFDGVIDAALAEDVGAGDVTTNATIDAATAWSGAIVARRPGVVAGLPVSARTFTRVDPLIEVSIDVLDGTGVAAGDVLARLTGPARGLLTGERVALNFLGHLSGIATLTRTYVEAAGHRTRIADTRKTIPGLRSLERYAVRAGGGVNHRFGLADAVLVKDNHLEAVGGIAEAVRRVRNFAPAGTIVVVECDDLMQVREALAAGVDAVLLDNMDLAMISEAVGLARGKALVEASGGMTLDRVSAVAAAGVDVISVGALTHSAPALDVALDFARRPAKVST